MIALGVYGSGSWAASNKCNEKRITLFELWACGRAMRISWTEYKTNVCLPQRLV